MEILRLCEAIELYLLMKPYLPNTLEDIAPIDFIRQLVDNIIKANKPKVYVEMVSMMTKVDISVLVQNSPDDVLSACMDGLLENFVLELIDFCRKIGL